MEELTEKQIKNRWVDIKRQITERQLLAYRVGIPLEKWDSYMHSLPEPGEINRIYLAIQEDRKTKTARIKEGLSKIVGYRESKEFSRKSGVSDTSIRDIIEGKKVIAGYDIINKLELFISTILPDFEPSIENTLTLRNYTRDYIGEMATEINSIADNLKRYCFSLTELARKGESETGWDGKKNSPTKQLEYSINSLRELKEKIDTFWGVFIDKNL